MAKPAILCVDDEPEVAAAVERDIRSRYRADYRVISATSGADALETVRELKRRGDTIALLIVDQRMPEMTGTEFLCFLRLDRMLSPSRPGNMISSTIASYWCVVAIR